MVILKKGDGSEIEYDSNKIASTLRRCGASEETVTEILSLLEKTVYDGMLTKEIYRIAMKQLRKRDELTASRFTLKDALMRLGDSGYPFEVFIEKLLQREGYTTQRNQVIDGECVDHEIDVVAEKKGHVTLVECKHFRREDSNCRIQTALYVYARFMDLKPKFHDVMLVTNTLFSSQVMQYASCKGMHLLGWNYPKNNGLERRIDTLGLYPITLVRMKKAVLERLLAKEIVLLEDLAKLKVQEAMPLLGVSEKRTKRILKHAHDLVANPL